MFVSLCVLPKTKSTTASRMPRLDCLSGLTAGYILVVNFVLPLMTFLLFLLPTAPLGHKTSTSPSVQGRCISLTAAPRNWFCCHSTTADGCTLRLCELIIEKLSGRVAASEGGDTTAAGPYESFWEEGSEPTPCKRTLDPTGRQ